MHQSGQGKTRKQRVQQVINKNPAVAIYDSYIPIGNAVTKLHRWAAQGAQVSYLSSHTNADDVEKDRSVLKSHNFPKGEIYFRQTGEQYADVVERVMPDVFIEDTCESIGGEREMTSPHLSRATKKRVRTHVVPEFGGIDHLPDRVSDS